MSGERTTPRYGFIGNGAFAARCLALLADRLAPSWVITSPPTISGRGKKLTNTPTADTAASIGIAKLITSNDPSNDDRVAALFQDDPVDFTFVIDFGHLIKGWLLNDGGGCLNIHPSLLPKYRGAAPIQRALMDRRELVGVTIFKLTRGMDSGPILLQREIEARDDDAATLLDRAAKVGVDAFIELYDAKTPSDWIFTPQVDAEATYAHKISKDEERIEWSSPAEQIVGKIRALAPQPGAWTTISGKRLKIISAAVICGGGDPGEMDLSGALPTVAASDGAVELRFVQPEGKKVLDARDWKNGLRDLSEVRLV